MGERLDTEVLELWCKRVTQGYGGVAIENMSTSWKDGLAFCALIHHFRPDLIEYDSLDENDIYGNNELAFQIAKNHLGIPALLDPEDMVCVEIPDKLSILTYLWQFHQTFSSQASIVIASSAAITSTKSPNATSNTGSRQNPPMILDAGVGCCRVCNQSVFSVQGPLISGYLLHGTCFKCVRCDTQLSEANYYESQDGRYYCETCSHEERMVAVSTTAVDGGSTGQDQGPSLVGDHRALFEKLVMADYKDDHIINSMMILEEKIACTDNDSHVIVSSDDKIEESCRDDKIESCSEGKIDPCSDPQTTVPISESGSRETFSDVAIVADEPIKNDTIITSSVPIVSEEQERSIFIPFSPPPRPPRRKLLGLRKLNSLPVLLPDDLKRFHMGIGNDNITLVESYRKNIPALLPGDLKRVLEYSFAQTDDDIFIKEMSESTKDLEIKTPSNEQFNMTYYDSNKEMPVQSPRKKIKSPIKIIHYSDSLNPFDDQKDDDKYKNNSTNSFGSDIEELAAKKNVSLKPFSNDLIKNETLSQGPLLKPRKALSLTLRSRHKIKYPIKIVDYPESLNPFYDEEDDDKHKNNSTNPFGSDIEEIAVNVNVVLNPFPSNEIENETLSQPHLAKQRTMFSSPSSPILRLPRKINSPIKIADYPESLNPFYDEENDYNYKTNNANPFGSDIEDEVAEKNVNLKSFSSGENENVTLCQPPLCKSRTVSSPVLRPRYQIKYPIKIVDYPESLNPFYDEEEDDKHISDCTNLFRLDIKDDEELIVKNNVSLNSCLSDEFENETMSQSSWHKSRTVLSPILTPWNQIHHKIKNKPVPPPPKSRPSVGKKRSFWKYWKCIIFIV